MEQMHEILTPYELRVEHMKEELHKADIKHTQLKHTFEGFKAVFERDHSLHDLVKTQSKEIQDLAKASNKEMGVINS